MAKSLPDQTMPPEQVAALLPYLDPARAIGRGEDPDVIDPDTLTLDTDADYTRLGRWVQNLCLMAGATFETAARVAALFVEGIRKSRNLKRTSH